MSLKESTRRKFWKSRFKVTYRTPKNGLRGRKSCQIKLRQKACIRHFYIFILFSIIYFLVFISFATMRIFVRFPLRTYCFHSSPLSASFSLIRSEVILFFSTKIFIFPFTHPLTPFCFLCVLYNNKSILSAGILSFLFPHLICLLRQSELEVATK